MRFLCILLLLISPLYAQSARNIATAPMGFYVDNGGNDANDGLTFATAKQHYCVTLRSAYNDWDFRGFQPYMFVRSGQVFNEMCGTGGVLVGIDAIIIAPYDPAHPSSPGNIVPSPDYIRTCTYPGCGNPDTSPRAQWCDSYGDLAIQIYYNATYASCNRFNMAGGGAIVLHNVATVDIFGARSTFSGSGNLDTAVLSDGPGIITIAHAPLIEGQFGYPIQCNRHCDLTISDTFELYFANVQGFYGIYGASHVDASIPLYKVTSSVYGPSVISGYSTFNDNGSPILGGVNLPNNGLICHSAC